MEARAHGANYGKDIPMSVAKEFVKADKGKKFTKAMKKKRR